MSLIHVALDAMGGDHAPSVVVQGAVAAAREAEGRYRIILCGPKDRIEAELEAISEAKSEAVRSGIEIHHAPDLVGMDESPTSVLKTKAESGLVSCVSLQKAGRAQASISAGNSGAMMAACLMVLGRAGGISRPAIACVMPALDKRVVVVDCGANVDEKALNLVHFGICGSIYSETMLGIASPKVGLLNMGEEEKKGPEVLQEAHQLLKQAPLNFIGNVEGRDLLLGEADVIVTPGYTGNVVLKLMEGFFEYHHRFFGRLDTELGRKFYREWDYSNIGGALLLGLNGTGLITHGRADARTIKNGLETAFRLAERKVAEKIAAKLTQGPQAA